MEVVRIVGPNLSGWDSNGNLVTAGDLIVWSNSLGRFQELIEHFDIIACHGVAVDWRRQRG